MPLKLTGLWQHDDFLRLWSGQTISVFGSMIGGTALDFTAILVLGATPVQLGVLNAMKIVPGLLAGLFAGAWVDRLHRRPLLIGADVGRALVLASLPLAALLGALHIAQVYGVALLISILSVFFDVAYQAYLPALVGKHELVEGNSKLSASAAVAEFGGFSVAGALVQALTAPMAILIDAASFVVSAVTLGMIRTPEAAITMAAGQAGEPNLYGEIGEGLKTVWGHPLLRASAAVELLHNLGNGVFAALVVLYMSRGLGFSPAVLTPIWAVGGLSSFAGAALAPRLSLRWGAGLAMAVGLGVAGLSGLFIPLASGATLLSGICLGIAQLGDGFFTVYQINVVSLWQSITHERLLGRVNATMKIIALAATLAGSLAGGLLGQAVGVRATLAGAVACTLAAAVVLGLSPVRKFRN
jgi:predicted MFS family arabinose efflux permease